MVLPAVSDPHRPIIASTLPPIPAIPNDVFLRIMAFVDTPTLMTSAEVASSWRHFLNTDQRGWKERCDRLWEGKIYVPEGLRILAGGEEGVQSWVHEQRGALGAMGLNKIKQDLLVHGVPRREVAGCFEKREYVELLYKKMLELTQADLGGRVSKMEPWHPQYLMDLLERGEGRMEGVPYCPAKLAYVNSVFDAKRCSISEAELCSFTFHVRVRADGPFGPCVPDDPWWQGKGHGKVRFFPTKEGGSMAWEWPEVDGEVMNPFAAMMDVSQMNDMSWHFEERTDNTYLQLFISGQRGPQEVVARHPVNWGWILFSNATVWTSWPHLHKDMDPFVGNDQTVQVNGCAEVGVGACWNFRNGGMRGYGMRKQGGQHAYEYCSRGNR